jgi:hypothetical protein
MSLLRPWKRRKLEFDSERMTNGHSLRIEDSPQLSQ